jgi:protein TonB
MNLTVDASGRVIEADIVRPSTSRMLDRRALAIVRAAGPFGHFSADMLRSADQIVVTSRFRFTRDEGLETSLSSSTAR